MNNYILKYRPMEFSEVLGQEIVIEQLINYIAELRADESKKLKIQPILLTGPPGVGKTTSARLIARALNCEEEKKLPGCGCYTCKQDVAMDYKEIDGSTANGVVAITDIVEISKRTPYSRFLIIFIDEAHRLSGAAKDKLLHQTEEPPNNVLYILGTTEENKIDDALLSRCKVRRFSLISDTIITKYLLNLIKQENNTLVNNTDKKKIVNSITAVARGSMRMALTKLGDVLNLSEITLPKAIKSLGLTDYTKVAEVISTSLLGIDKGLALNFTLEKSGGVIKICIEQVGDILNDLLNVKAGCDSCKIFDGNYYNKMFPEVTLHQAATFVRIYLNTTSLKIYSFSLLNLILVDMHLEYTKITNQKESKPKVTPKSSLESPSLNVKPDTSPSLYTKESNGAKGTGTNLFDYVISLSDEPSEIKPELVKQIQTNTTPVEEILIDEEDLFKW